MVDLHSHILFAADDGPTTLEQTVELFEAAVNEGITTIIATPHFNHPRYHVTRTAVTTQIQLLQHELLKYAIPLTLLPGHEVRLSEQIIPLYQSTQFHTLANSNYLLLELPMDRVPFYTVKVIEALVREGITPIIAHPERNKAILEKPIYLANLVQAGALAQVTAGSLAGHFGRKIQKVALYLVRENLVHVYGSDVHNVFTRPFLFSAGLHYLERKKEGAKAERLLANNEKVLRNASIRIEEPVKVSRSNWWGL